MNIAVVTFCKYCMSTNIIELMGYNAGREFAQVNCRNKLFNTAYGGTAGEDV